MLVHIGYKKCGSTWLQRNLFNRMDRGFFPLAPAKNRNDSQVSKHLGEYFVFDADGYFLDPFSNRSSEIRPLVDEWSRDAGNRVPVVSWERLTGQGHAAGLDAGIIAERIADAFPHAKILIVIREQISAAVSLYFQYLKAGGHRHYRHYFSPAADKAMPRFSPHYLEYHKLIAHYYSVFGTDNVLCLPMEIFREPQEFLVRLRDFTGADVPEDLPFERPENAALSRAVELRTRHLNLLKRAHSLNGYAFETPQFVEHGLVGLRNALSALTPTTYEVKIGKTIRADVARMLGGRFSDSNAETERLIGIPLKAKFGYM